MPAYRSKTNKVGHHMAGARSLWRATGIKNAAFKNQSLRKVLALTRVIKAC